jgi:hypothetical protein
MKAFGCAIGFLVFVVSGLPMSGQSTPLPSAPTAVALPPSADLQAAVDDCPVSKPQSAAGITWDLIYPASKASYVGGILPEMQMREKWWQAVGRSILIWPRQFRRKGQITLSRECLLFAFSAVEGEGLEFDKNANYHVIPCTNKVDLSEKKVNLSKKEDKSDRLCKLTKSGDSVGSYIVAIPYAEVNTLARAKYAPADLTGISTAYATAAAAILTAIAGGGLTATTERVLGIVGPGMALYYYLAILLPRTGDNYIAIFVEPPAKQIGLSRQSNVVTVAPTSPHYFVGEQIQVSDVEATDLPDNDISSISRDKDGKVTVRVKNADRFKVGTQVKIAKVENSSFNGQFQVLTSEPGEFTYKQEDKPQEQSKGGKAKDVWNGAFVIDSIAPTITYEQLGPDDSTVSTGTIEAAAPGNANLTIKGNLAPTTANPRSVDLSGTVAVNQPPAKSDELFKKGDLVMFRIPNKHDYYNISMTLTSGTGLTFVNEATDKAGK